ncbi:hypothetical protein BDZ97DRAFT_1852990 [Flammula alnicola]|nr:hypothetical protein BDZ97DRAFT_1852990 [Flammula alnicola]
MASRNSNLANLVLRLTRMLKSATKSRFQAQGQLKYSLPILRREKWSTHARQAAVTVQDDSKAKNYRGISLVIQDGLYGHLLAPRPRYASDECSEDHSSHIVTSDKASLSYSGFSSGSNWVDWCYGVNNSAGLMSSFFLEDGSHFINLKPRGLPFIVVVICATVVLTIQRC